MVQDILHPQPLKSSVLFEKMILFFAPLLTDWSTILMDYFDYESIRACSLRLFCLCDIDYSAFPARFWIENCK